MNFGAGPGHIAGYAQPWDVTSGQQTSFMLSAKAEDASFELVRLVGGGSQSAGDSCSFAYEVVDHPVNGTVDVAAQPIFPGSYVLVENAHSIGALTECTFVAWIWPTLVGGGVEHGLFGTWCGPEQGSGLSLLIDARGALAVRYGRSARASDAITAAFGPPLRAREWWFVACSVRLDVGTVTAYRRPLRLIAKDDAFLSEEPLVGSGGATIGGDTVVLGGMGVLPRGAGRNELLGGYNGKLERPRFLRAALSKDKLPLLAAGPDFANEYPLTADWDFSLLPGSRDVTDRSPNQLHGQTYNSPARAMTSHDWSGEALDWRASPEEYGAIHFHSDDLDDAHWRPTVESVDTSGLPSGIYAGHVSCGSEEDFVPLFVRPQLGHPTARIAVIIPTLTYMAYSNFDVSIIEEDAEGQTGEAGVFDRVDRYVADHVEVGYSLYNHHTDGSGICHVSWRRPMLNIRPNYRWYMSRGGGWCLSSDMFLMEWLAHEGILYDVLTDDALHAGGAALLAPYRAVLTGSHPEYVTSRMLDALDEYTAEGGKLMYLGGNGFYWVTSYLPDRPHVIEIRRGNQGSRTWSGNPGEDHHSSTGEPGGLWKARGRAPQALVGVGFASEGGGDAAPYRRTKASFDPAAAFIFEGVEDDEIIGDFGYVNGGAAGDEIDRADNALGTPHNALLLASSQGLQSNNYQRTIDEVPQMLPGYGGQECDDVRADMTYFETAGGGAVFSVGSIDWSGSLPWNGCDNNVARITLNVLERFAVGEEEDPGVLRK